MARTSKPGIDYFPLDCVLDQKFELIEAEFGLTGFSVVVKLFQKIYGGEGYYCDWDSEVALLFAKNIGMGGNVVSDIVRKCLDRGIFSKELFQSFQIITSKGIQERYLKAVERRTAVKLINEYLLINVRNFKNDVYVESLNVNILTQNADKSTQRKVKESKVNKSIYNARDLATDFEKFWTAYPKKVSRNKAEMVWSNLDMTDQLLQEILEGISRQKTSKQWTDDAGRYIPNPANWLAGKRWLDEVQTRNRGFTDHEYSDEDFAAFEAFGEVL